MIDLDDKILRRDKNNKSRWLYRCTCNNCGKDRGYKRPSHADRLCKVCFGKLTHTGKTVSEETRQKMRDSNYLNNGGTHSGWGGHRSEETKQKLSKSQKEYCAKHGNQFLTGKSAGKHTQETVIKISENNTGKPPQWKGRTFQYDGPQGSFKLRSSYELFYARWLDDQGIKWDYEPHFKLSNGKMFSPDFKLEDGVIIEIKGYWTKIGAEKWTLFCSDYSEIPKKVLMKSDLIKLGMKGK